MLKFLNLKPEIFGIDINDLSLRIVKLQKKRNGFKLVSFNEVDMQPGIVKEGIIQDKEALVKIIKNSCNTVKGKNLNTTCVAVALPEEKSFSQVIQVPKMNEEELKLAVPLEAENYIPLTIDKVYLDFQIIGKDNDGHLDLLINAMPRSIIDSYIFSLKKAGLTPSILEVESQSIVRALVKKGEQNAPIIFVDFGQTKTSFIIFSNGSIRFTSSIPISSEQMTATISQSLNISLAKAEEYKIQYGLTEEGEKKYNIKKIIKPILDDLTGQIRKYINFYHNHISLTDVKIGKVILCGGGVSLKDLPAFLFEELKIPVEIGDPLINIIRKEKSHFKLIAPQKILSFTTALGLALRGAGDIENIE